MVQVKKKKKNRFTVIVIINLGTRAQKRRILKPLIAINVSWKKKHWSEVCARFTIENGGDKLKRRKENSIA